MSIDFNHRVLTKKQANFRRALEVATLVLLVACSVGAMCGFVIRGVSEGWPTDVGIGAVFLGTLIVVFPFVLLPLPSFNNALDAQGYVRLQQLAARHPELAETILGWLRDPTLELRRDDLTACREYIEELQADGKALRGWRLQERVL